MKILIVQTSYLGDVILSTPVIAGVRQAYPSAEIWMMTTPRAADLVIRDPLLAGVITLDKRGRDAGITGLARMVKRLRGMAFDMVFSLHRSYRTAIILTLAAIPVRIGFSDARLSFLYHQCRRRNQADHDVLRNLAILDDGNFSPVATDLRLHPPSAVAGEKVIAAQPASPYAVLVPGSAWATKRWHSEGYRRTALYLLKLGYQVVLLGSPADIPINRQVAAGLQVHDLAGQTSVADAMALISGAGLVVCNDSMALHAASAFKVPTVAIFCATTPLFGFGPWKNNAMVVEKELTCRPCSRHGGHRCPNGTEACMRNIDFDRIVAAIHSVCHLS
ncbi:MAG: lipopolysaccharide heptosyltransferase II [Thermodesulfobacteriota bacterium]